MSKKKPFIELPYELVADCCIKTYSTKDYHGSCKPCYQSDYQQYLCCLDYAVTSNIINTYKQLIDQITPYK
jgi:hypothetical protein